MLDPQGKPYELAAVESSGNKEFEKAALKAIENAIFEPASINGEPIHSAVSQKIVYELPGTRSARSKFVRAYKRLLKSIEAADRARADTELAALEVQNLYEEAFSNLARYNYYRKWGTETEQLDALRRAIAREEDARYLPTGMFEAALLALSPLELKAKDFVSALSTWNKLQTIGADEASLAPFKKIMADVQALRTDNRTYSVPGKIDDGSWFYDLYKNRFHFNVSSGRIAEIKLRCEKQYIRFPYDPEMQYQIQNNFGVCHMQVLGDPGTTFELVQS